jgi:septum formation protein
MLILASASPRRRELLAAVGLEPSVMPQEVDESAEKGETPIAYVARIARAKAEACKAEGVVLAADTTVAIDGEILAKAADEEDAVRMLSLLSGRTHAVHTAVVVKSGARVVDRVVTTAVRFRSLSDDEIRSYVKSGEPMDKAGAYGIQGKGGALVAAIDGSYTNVVGLPIEETLALLRLAGALP